MLKKLIRKIPGAVRLAQHLRLIPDDMEARRFLLDLLPRQSVGAEVGVHLGDFSHECMNRLVPRELHLIDPWEHQDSEQYKNAWYGGQAESGQKEMDQRHDSVCNRFRKEIDAGCITVHRGYSTDVLEQFPDGYFDWVYIDGNHLYDFVKADLELSFRKVKAGGYITGDDYGEGGWWDGGVKKAVDEFGQGDNVELVELRNGQFIFKKLV
jgi:hypothetical protein